MPATIVATVTQGGVKYRLVKDVTDTPNPIVEKHVATDAVGVEAWVRLTPQSDTNDIWNALQAALTRL
jgi:microcompartment protein CcmK/EutM